MTRFAIDAATALRIVREDPPLPDGIQLVGPTVLRSDVLAALYRDARAGVLSRAEGRHLRDRLAELKVRLLGDRVSRARAWQIAADRNWDEIGPAEYLAVAALQADVLVTQDAFLRAGAEGLIPVVGFDDLLAG